MFKAWFNKLKQFFKPKPIVVDPPVNPNVPPIQEYMNPNHGDYESLWSNAELLPSKKHIVESAVVRIIANKKLFEAGVEGTSVPWWWLAGIMYRENDVNMSRQMLNGEPWSRKTTIVPKGLGPWNSWVESTKYAIRHMGLDRHPDWSMRAALMRAERWNGMGYSKKGLRSPYLWAGTNFEQPGMYVADGKFDSNKVDPRIGVAAIWKRLDQLGFLRTV